MPVLGRITINLTASDVTDPAENDVWTGDYLSLFGNGITLDEAARSARTNAYELPTGMGKRCERRHVLVTCSNPALETYRRARNLFHRNVGIAMTTSTNQVEINSELLAEARQMDIDAVNVAERALMREIKSRRDEIAGDEAARAWQEQNAEAIAWSNKRFEEHGFPFPQYRRY